MPNHVEADQIDGHLVLSDDMDGPEEFYEQTDRWVASCDTVEVRQ